MSTSTSIQQNLAITPLSAPTSRLDSLLERDLLPDWLIRIGIRRLLKQRLREEDQGDVERQQAHLLDFVASVEGESSCHVDRCRESAALRSSVALLPARAGPAFEIQQRAVGAGHNDARRGREGDAGADVPARSSC